MTEQLNTSRSVVRYRGSESEDCCVAVAAAAAPAPLACRIVMASPRAALTLATAPPALALLAEAKMEAAHADEAHHEDEARARGGRVCVLWSRLSPREAAAHAPLSRLRRTRRASLRSPAPAASGTCARRACTRSTRSSGTTRFKRWCATPRAACAAGLHGGPKGTKIGRMRRSSYARRSNSLSRLSPSPCCAPSLLLMLR